MSDTSLTVCPICNESLVFPCGDCEYCEECGWPDEDFDGIYHYPKMGEKLEKYQPHLEYYSETNKKWVQSGIITGTQTEAFRGFYRYSLNEKL